jgi:hypothetical protein
LIFFKEYKTANNVSGMIWSGTDIESHYRSAVSFLVNNPGVRAAADNVNEAERRASIVLYGEWVF